MSIVATNDSFRNIITWEQYIHANAVEIVNDFVRDPVLTQNFRNLLQDGYSNEEMLDRVHNMVDEVEGQIATMVARYMHTGTGGFITSTVGQVATLDAPMHLTITDIPHNYSVTGYNLLGGRWVMQNLVQFMGGQAITARAPGTFAFTGREILIHGIEEVAHGRAIHAMVTRFGLEDFFGAEIELDDLADREMVIGSIARIAGAPRGADQIEWAVRNLNVSISSRNPDALIQNQEAVAVIMALYERGTSSRVADIRIRDFRRTAEMNLDRRYAQAVRAAFEVGILTDTGFNPTAAITVGEFLEMLGNFNSRVRV
jgi:hypothetical protein